MTAITPKHGSQDEPRDDRARMPEGYGPGPRARRASWGLFGLVLALVVLGLTLAGWFVAGWAGVVIAAGIGTAAVMWRLAPVLVAGWLRRNDGARAPSDDAEWGG